MIDVMPSRFVDHPWVAGEVTPLALNQIEVTRHQGKSPERPTFRFTELTPLASRLVGRHHVPA